MARQKNQAVCSKARIESSDTEYCEDLETHKERVSQSQVSPASVSSHAGKSFFWVATHLSPVTQKAEKLGKDLALYEEISGQTCQQSLKISWVSLDFLVSQGSSVQ